MKKIFVGIGVVLVIIIGAFFLQPANVGDTDAVPVQGDGTATGINIGDIAPDFTLSTLDGQTVSLSDYRGTAVMIDFWAEWCPFCTGEFPVMQQAFKKFEDQDFVILGVHRTATEPVSTARSFVDRIGATFPILLDTEDETYQTFVKVRAMPASVFIDREGVIRSRIFGPKQLELLEDEIRNIL